MQSGYGGVSEIQQFMVDASAQSPFSISSAQNPSAASPSVAGEGQQLQRFAAAAAPFYKLIDPPFHPHPHQHTHNPPSPPPVPMQFPHFPSVPITQQLFARLPHPQHHQHHLQLFGEPESENYYSGSSSIIMPSFLAADDSSGSVIFQDDDASESRFRPWLRQEDCHIKEPFWRRPLDLDCINRDNKRCKDKEPEEPLPLPMPLPLPLHLHLHKQSHELALGLENSQSHPPKELFSELEAIYNYKPAGGSTSTTATDADGACSCKNNMTNQTTASGSALTGSGGAEDPANLIKSTGRWHEQPRQPRLMRKRKRKRKRKMESISAFLSGLIKRLMDHQEALHQQFIDEMERRDRERAGREETWREQEVVRARREAAARANDRSLALAREAAIISFVRKITGETLSLSLSLSLSLPQHSDNNNNKDNNNYSQPTAHAIGDINIIEKRGPGVINARSRASSSSTTAAGAALMMTTTSRWPRSEVEALIRVRSGLERRFQEPGLLKGPLWEEVSASLALIGYQRSAKRCKEKWENINKYFRKAKESGRDQRSHFNSKTCPYFQQLQLYSNSSHPPPSDLFHDDVVLARDHDPVLTQRKETNQPGLFDDDRL